MIAKLTAFRAYDIRGKYPKEIDEELAEKTGIAFINFTRQKKVFLGRDVRLSSPSLGKSMTKGLTAAGAKVFDIGLVPTPVLYFAVCHYRFKAGVMITASHLPKDQNGIKLEKRNAIGLTWETGIKKIRDNIEKNKLHLAKHNGTTRLENIEEEYVKYVAKRIKLKKKLKVVIDSGNGACSVIAPKIFRKLGCNVIELYCKFDGKFPNHIADPHDYSTLKALQKKVLAEKANFGIALDGDGDRAGYVDDKGRIITEDNAISIFIMQALKVRKGKIVVDVRTSNKIISKIKKYGGKPAMTRVGHSYIAERCRKEKAILGAEETGHTFFPYCYYNYDDGIFAGLKMAEFVSRLNTKLSDFIDKLPKGAASPEIRIQYPDEKKFELIEKVRKELKKRKWKFIAIDGARINFPNGWALIRASNTGPQLTFRFEGKTQKDLVEIKNKIKTLMNGFGVKI